jgi:hypothetical protein
VTPSGPTITALIDDYGIARLDAVCASVIETDLHDMVADCHLDPEIRAVVMTRGLITAIVETPQPTQKGIRR